MLQFHECCKVYGGTVTAVKDVTLDIPKGSMVGVIGRSGAGKSTLLRMTNRLVDVTSGRIVFDDRDVTRLRGRKLLEWRRQCAMIFQQFGLVKRLDVLTNVLLGRLNYHATLPSLIGFFSNEERALAVHTLDRLDMAELALQRADTLSGGQQQRVAIARALMQQPQIVLADEPIASLDPRSARMVMESLRKINEEDGITVICNLHTLETARDYCSRVVGMLHGEVVFDGPPHLLSDTEVRNIYGMESGVAQDQSTVVPPEIIGQTARKPAATATAAG